MWTCSWVRRCPVREKRLSREQVRDLIFSIRERYEESGRFRGASREKIQERLEKADPEKLWSLNEMDSTGGEPAVIDWDPKTGEVIFFDCVKELPPERHDMAYDEFCRSHYGAETMVGAAKAMGVDLLDKHDYVEILQKLGLILFVCICFAAFGLAWFGSGHGCLSCAGRGWMRAACKLKIIL